MGLAAIVGVAFGSGSVPAYLWALWLALMVPMTALAWAKTAPGGASMFAYWPGSIYIVLALPAAAAGWAALAEAIWRRSGVPDQAPVLGAPETLNRDGTA